MALDDYWNRLAPGHALIENNYFDLSGLDHVAGDVRPPVLIVGAGQGLIVDALRQRGIRADGIDLSPEMIRYASNRRGIDLIQADAVRLPFADGSYRTIVCASGVIDFMTDEDQILAAVTEMKRVVAQSGPVCVAFYRLSPASEQFMSRLGMLREHRLSFRESIELQSCGPFDAIRWVSRKGGIGILRSGIFALGTWLRTPFREKRLAMNMQRVMKRSGDTGALYDRLPKRSPIGTHARSAISLNGFRFRPGRSRTWIAA
jgi:SAM-dependent methyltransferase